MGAEHSPTTLQISSRFDAMSLTLSSRMMTKTMSRSGLLRRSMSSAKEGELPVYDPASKLGMKQIWPLVAGIAAVYFVGLSVNPFANGQLDRAKGKATSFSRII